MLFRRKVEESRRERGARVYKRMQGGKHESKEDLPPMRNSLLFNAGGRDIDADADAPDSRVPEEDKYRVRENVTEGQSLIRYVRKK